MAVYRRLCPPLTSAGCWAPSSGRTGAVRRRWRCAAGRCRVLPAGSAADLLPARALRLLKRRYGAAITRCRCRRGSSWRRRPAGRWRPSPRSSRFDFICSLGSIRNRTGRLVSNDSWAARAITRRLNVGCHSVWRYVTEPYALHSLSTPPPPTVRKDSECGVGPAQ